MNAVKFADRPMSGSSTVILKGILMKGVGKKSVYSNNWGCTCPQTNQVLGLCQKKGIRPKFTCRIPNFDLKPYKLAYTYYVL